MKTEIYTIGDEDIKVYIFENWMSHEDWHIMEDQGLKYVKYVHEGPDYWDDYLIFAKPEDVEKLKWWYSVWDY